MRRVVVTGLGLVSPVGCDVETAWGNILAGKSGASLIEHFDVSDLACKVAAVIPRVDGRAGGSPEMPGAFDPDAVMSKRDRKRIDDFILYGIAAADQAVKHSGWKAETEEQSERAGVILGSGIGGIDTTYEASILLRDRGPRRLSPFVIPAMLINLPSGQVSIRHGLKGPNSAIATACATGAHAIGDAARIIACGDADMMVAGGCEASITRLGIASFVACRAMTTGYNETPEAASRPYDEGRDGFLMGEGAGVVVLEDYESAKARGANILAECVGYGLSGDAHHITSPAPEGEGGFRAMRMALKKSGLDPSDIGYVNAHGTSTPMGDELEVRAVERLLGDHASKAKMSSTKSATGHLLGAAGAVESIFSILALRDKMAPPTLNLENPNVETPLDLVPLKAVPFEGKAVMSNSFGFGGTNAALIFVEAE